MHRYILEVITFVAVILVFIVYTETFYILPLSLKTLLTAFTWINVKKVFNNSGYGTDAKGTTLQTALLYKDQPSSCGRNKKDEELTEIASGYQLRKDHVEKSQVVSFCSSLHIDFLQCPR